MKNEVNDFGVLMPSAKLSNGLVVTNFSSPHEFEFEDGTILNSCSKEHAEKYKVDFIEELGTQFRNNIKFKAVKLTFGLSDILVKEINNIIDSYNKENCKFDIVLIPLPMLTAIKENRAKLHQFDLVYSPFRVIRMKSRTEKVVKIDEFCL